MAVKVCLDCTATYEPGLANCPHCHSERSQLNDGDPYRGGDMPHITRRGGPSNRYEIRGEHGPELVDPPASDEGGETPSPGSSSQTSTAKPPATRGKSAKPRQSRARTTANRSRPAPTGAASSASSTDTAGPKTAADD